MSANQIGAPAQNSLTNPTSQPVSIGIIPREGPKVVGMTFDFTTLTDYYVDLSQQQKLGLFSQLQSVFIDNSANAAVCVLLNPQTGQNLIAPPASQGYYDFLATQPMNFQIHSMAAGGGLLVMVHFFNVKVSPFVWKIT